MIVNGNLTTPNGTKYEVGGEEDYDRWMEENGGDEKNNPYLVMEFGEDNLYKPKFNETQDKAAKEYARAQITGALDYSEEKVLKGWLRNHNQVLQVLHQEKRMMLSQVSWETILLCLQM